jgi:hypothetical protein
MTHKEFKLTVKKNIVEDAGYGRTAVHYRVGDTFTVDEATFDKLQSGATIERYTLEGIITLDKYNFENEVQVTTITIENSTRKLGQRKNK